MQDSHESDSTGQTARPRNPPSDDLTCNEGQVEDLLSEGESTEKESSPRDRIEQKQSPRRMPPVNASPRKRR
jgi:hypothetical protein